LHELALSYLEQDPLLHMGMIVPIKRGTAQILYAAPGGVCQMDTKSSAYMLSVANFETERQLIELLPSGKMVTFHRDFLLEELKSKLSFPTLARELPGCLFIGGAASSILFSLRDTANLQLLVTFAVISVPTCAKVCSAMNS